VVPEAAVALQRVRGRNPSLLFAQAQVDAAQATLDARRAEGRQPTVDAVGAVARNRVGSDATGSTVTQSATVGSIGLQINLPLWTGGLQAGRDKEAFALLTKASADRDEALNSVQTELRDGYQTLAQAREQVAVQQQVVRTAAATVEALRKAFVAGYRSNVDLLNAQQQVDVARQGLLSARVAVLTAQVGILALLDELDDEHIAALATPAAVPTR
jgi:outer membrane protein TolC